MCFITYVFGNLDAPRPFTDADRKVCEQMMARWLAFIQGRLPNAPGLSEWPFQVTRPAIMHLGDKVGPEPLLPKHKLRLNDQYVDRVGFMTPRG